MENSHRIIRGMEVRRKGNLLEKDRITIHEGRTDSAPYLTFPLLDTQKEWVMHAVSTRLGGVSRGTVSSMNLSFAREKESLIRAARAENPGKESFEDETAQSIENVRENYRRMGIAAGFVPDSLVFSFQTHTANIRKVTLEDRGKGFERERDYKDVDGLMTNVPGLTLTIFSADCVPLFLADPVHRVIAASHSGWRGTVCDIGGETVRSMQRSYGTRPEDIIACIGPSICQDCYEVSGDVIERFRRAYAESTWPALFYEKKTGGTEKKYQLNLQEACRQNFLAAGVKEENISLPDLCTRCNSSFLYSHRAAGSPDHGLLAGFIQIKAP